MNFFSGAIREGAFCLAGDAARVPLTSLASGLPVGPAVLGVRPEDLVVGAHSGIALADVTLDVAEHLGHETLAHFSLAGGDHVVRFGGEFTPQAGDRVPLAIRDGGLHVFADDAAGRRLG